MTSNSEVHKVPGIDLAFRPPSYFWPLGLETHLLARIKGAERRATVQRLIDAGRLDEIPNGLLQSMLDEPVREALGRIHPAFMGGEYLPDLTSNEVSIARITIASTTRDVTSVYARRCKHRIHYRVVDEYQGDTLSEKRARTSTQSLTLGELETFFSGAWSLFDVLDSNFGDGGYDLNQMLRFVVAVESEFYPQLGTLYKRRIEAWAAVRRAALRSDQQGTKVSTP